MMSFDWPWILLLLPLPWLVYRLVPATQQSSNALFMPLLSLHRPHQQLPGSGLKHRLNTALLATIWLLLLLAAAKPIHPGEPIELPTSGRDMFLAIDLSGSMNIQDMILDNRRVDRLTMLKHVLRDFIEQRQGDRIGLIVFASEAYVLTPLTFDLDTAQQLLDETQIGFAGQRTAIGDAIGLAIKQLKDNPPDQRRLILLTDGANNSGTLNPIRAAELAAGQGITIHTIAFGSDGSAAPPGLFGFAGRDFSDDIDEQALIRISELTNGRFFRARNQQELTGIYREIDQQEKYETEQAAFHPEKSLFYIPLAIAMLLALLLSVSQFYRAGSAS